MSKLRGAPKRMYDLMMSGAKVGTDNSSCRLIGTNQVPDIARKLRNKGIEVSDEEVKVIRFGRAVRCKRYFLDQDYISENRV